MVMRHIIFVNKYLIILKKIFGLGDLKLTKTWKSQILIKQARKSTLKMCDGLHVNQKHESMQNVFMHLGCTALFDYCFDPVYSLVLL